MNKSTFLPIIVLSFMWSLSHSAQSDIGWRGISPLNSTRMEVGKLLGKPTESRKSSDLYIFPDEKVSILYSSGPCLGPVPSWNVKEGTVLNVLVVPLKVIMFADLELGHEFVKGTIQDDLSVAYSDPNKGIKYEVSQSGDILTVSYTPPLGKEHLRCSHQTERLMACAGYSLHIED